MWANENKKDVRQTLKDIRQRLHIRAPELPTHFQWLNVSRPLTTEDLRGRVVLLDFWTYCCINCMHIQPDLKYLERKYADQPFVVIGVHSAKFYNEQDVENIRQAMLRYEIEHPVVIDQNFQIWQQYGVQAWPTLVLIDPDGYIVTYLSGEGHRNKLDLYIRILLDELEGHEKSNTAPLPIRLEKHYTQKHFLHFPGKITGDPQKGLLYITDSNNHRIVVVDTAGYLQMIIGSGQPGLQDGDFSSARFRRPQGVTLYTPDILLVADTENHAIRKIDLKQRVVRTIAGTGQQGFFRNIRGSARKVALNSPWDLTTIGDSCYIAMAGFHQIGLLHLKTGEYQTYAGSGQEARLDGPLHRAAFAQPSGITHDGQYLYIADSEISCVRRIDRKTGMVETLVGGDLFDFGDRDGIGNQVRLQHPLGIYFYQDWLYLADTYNHKIKRISPTTRRAMGFAGTGQRGFRDGKQAQFYEPGGVFAMGDYLYVTDTNNHRIRRVHLKSGAVHTLNIRFGSKPWTHAGPLLVANFPNIQTQHLPTQLLSPGNGTIEIHLQLPADQKLNPDSPIQYVLTTPDSFISSPVLGRIQTLNEQLLKWEIPIHVEELPRKSQLDLELLYYYCDKAFENSTCKVRAVHYRLPIQSGPGGHSRIVITDTVQ
ncbi:MAG: redoxin domain-containing protein [Calditrichaeota bacterium]|nr:redoxin domain-containing protein [Calditrichota bacterium]